MSASAADSSHQKDEQAGIEHDDHTAHPARYSAGRWTRTPMTRRLPANSSNGTRAKGTPQDSTTYPAIVPTTPLDRPLASSARARTPPLRLRRAPG